MNNHTPKIQVYFIFFSFFHSDAIIDWGENLSKELKQASGCPQLGGLTLKKVFPNVLEENQDSEYLRLQKSPELVN